MSLHLVPPPLAEVEELAKACVDYVERATKVRLDYTVETLPILDHYVREARRDVQKGEIIEVIAAPVGAYLGEVARRILPLGWFTPPGAYKRWRIELENLYLSLNPIGAVVEALLLQEAPEWGASFRMLPADEARAKLVLEKLPAVEEDEYYAPSSRLEVLQIVVDALTGGREPARRFGPDDYAAARAETIDANTPRA